MAQGRDGIVSHSPAMQRLLEELSQRASAPGPVLLVGETGAGKRRLARWLHARSGVAAGPLVVCQLAGEPEEVIGEALSAKLRQAEGGTLFLDEIGDLPTPAQALALEATRREGVRVIASSSDDLSQAASRGAFLEALLAALGAAVRVPPLRERREDLPALIEGFLLEAGLPPESVAPSAREALLADSWPENVRELKHVIVRALHANGGVKIKLDHLPARFRAVLTPQPPQARSLPPSPTGRGGLGG
jgi:two-component system, NtrC family, response regulator AtoC